MAGSSSSPPMAKPKKLMMGLGNRITVGRRASQAKLEAAVAAVATTSAPAHDSSDFDFASPHRLTLSSRSASPDSIQPSPVLLGTSDGFDSASPETRMSFASASTSVSEDRKSSLKSSLRALPVDDDHDLGLQLARKYINDSDNFHPDDIVSTGGESDYEDEPTMHNVNNNRLSGLGLFNADASELASEAPAPLSQQPLTSRVKNLFTTSYTPVGQGPAGAYHEAHIDAEPSYATATAPPQGPTIKSLPSPAKPAPRLQNRSSMTFSKKLVFGNVDEMPDQRPAPVTNSPHKSVTEDEDDSDFEIENLLPQASAAAPAGAIGGSSLTRRPSERPRSLMLPNASAKVMTKSQFDNYRQSVIGISTMAQSDAQSDDEPSDADDDEAKPADRKYLTEEEDDKKQSMRMRLKQDAHLSVYRQKMTKIASSQSSGTLAAFAASRTGSSGNLAAMATAAPMDRALGNSLVDDDEDEYDDVPLGILKAHGFPTGPVRAPHRSASHPDMRAAAPGLPGFAPTGAADPETASLRTTYTSGMHGGLVDAVPQMSPASGRPPLPGVFSNPMQTMNRGLIGEIAREEEARLKRRSMGNALSGMRASTMMGSMSNYEGSINNVPPPAPAADSSEIQLQLQQVMNMQLQMLHQMQGAPSPPLAPSMGPGQPMRKSFSTFADMRQPMVSSMSHYGMRPQSVRSVALSDHSADMGRKFYGSPVEPAAPFPAGARTSSPLRQTIADAADDDDDDEDDEAWKEMLEKRRGLKEMWKEHSVALAT